MSWSMVRPVGWIGGVCWILAGCGIFGEIGGSYGVSKEFDPSSLPEDSELQWYLENGWGGIALLGSCLSKIEGGPTLDEFRVGGGRWVECKTLAPHDRGAMPVYTENGEEWCALGRVTSHKVNADPRLQAEVTDTPAGEPWTVIVTHEGDEIVVNKVTFFGTLTWPVLIDLGYEVIDMIPSNLVQSCSEQFGL